MKKNRLAMMGAGLMVLGTVGCSSGTGDEPQTNEPEAPNQSETPVVVEKPKEYVPINLSWEESKVGSNASAFGWELLVRVMESEDIEGNLVISPLSAEIDLAMLANGAAGTNREQILNAVGFSEMDIADVNSYNNKLTSSLEDIDNTTTLAVANGVWFAKPLNPYESFSNILNASYNAPTYSVLKSDIVESVNNWCYEKTNGIIQKILDNECDVVIANAVYFRGVWAKAFDKGLTKTGKFHGLSGDSEVSYMNDNSDYNCLLSDKVAAIDIPFGNGAYSLTVFLPEENVSLQDAIADIVATKAYRYTGRTYEVELSIPKFKSDTKVNLRETLKAMGMTEAFDVTADFSALCSDQLTVSKVLQSTAFEIDELGGEGASVTATTMDVTAIPDEPITPKKIKIDINRPFVYSVTEQSTGAQIFLGIVKDL